jgi:hypothetical protein
MDRETHRRHGRSPHPSMRWRRLLPPPPQLLPPPPQILRPPAHGMSQDTMDNIIAFAGLAPHDRRTAAVEKSRRLSNCICRIILSPRPLRAGEFLPAHFKLYRDSGSRLQNLYARRDQAILDGDVYTGSLAQAVARKLSHRVAYNGAFFGQNKLCTNACSEDSSSMAYFMQDMAVYMAEIMSIRPDSLYASGKINIFVEGRDARIMELKFQVHDRLWQTSLLISYRDGSEEVFQLREHMGESRRIKRRLLGPEPAGKYINKFFRDYQKGDKGQAYIQTKFIASVRWPTPELIPCRFYMINWTQNPSEWNKLEATICLTLSMNEEIVM